MPSCGVCPSVRLSVCVSVTFLDSVKTSNCIYKFLPSGSHTIRVFPCKRHGNILTGPPYRGVESRWGRQKSRFRANIWLHCVVSTLQPASCYQHDAARPRTVPQVVTLIAGSKWPSLLMAGNNDEVYVKKSQRYAKDNRAAFNRTQ